MTGRTFELSCECDPGPSSTTLPSINACGSLTSPRRGSRQASIMSPSTCLCSFWVKNTSSLDAFALSISSLWPREFCSGLPKPKDTRKSVPLPRLSPQSRCKSETQSQLAQANPTPLAACSNQWRNWRGAGGRADSRQAKCKNWPL